MTASQRLTVAGLLALAGAQPAPAQPAAGAGEKLYGNACAPCHGGDGDGGERGPSLLEPRRGRSRSLAPGDLSALIRAGIPAAGMPAFPLAEPEMQALVTHVRRLLAPASDQPPAGDVAAGERFFFGKGNCSRCHRVGSQGGLFGPPLSSVGRERSLGRIQLALDQPGARRSRGSGTAPASWTGPGGKRVRGLIKNESNHDVQLLGEDGRLHLWTAVESTRAGLRRETRSLMPPLSASAEERRDLLAYLARLGGAGVSSPATPVAPGGRPAGGDAAAAFAAIVEPAPGDWPTYNGQLGGNRHSPLRLIHRGNVSRLAPRWMFPVPEGRQLQTTPLVVGGVMYLTAANQAFALDAATGRPIWHFSRPLTRGLAGDAARGINRGVAVLGDRVFMATDHAHLLALDRTTGQLLWDVEVADHRRNYGLTSAPLVVKDLVLIGTSGGDEGTRGFLSAFRADTGELAWRFFTVPAPGEPGSETWRGRDIAHPCAAPWLTGSFDPATGLVYWPTGNPCPDHDGDERQGDNLYSNSLLALDPTSGKLRWHYQFTPHDLHDWDAAQTVLTLDARWDPRDARPRPLLAQANRNGFFYVLDRQSGRLLLARPFVEKLTWAKSIGADGRPVLVPGQEPSAAGTLTCPAVEGATNWMSPAANPELGLFFVSALEKCSIYYKAPQEWQAGKSYYSGGTRRVRDEVPRKVLRALELRTGRIVWQVPQVGRAESWGGVLSTAGGLVFFGDDDGALAAVEARTGKPLWHFHTNAELKASPMTYLARGQQMVAIAAGGTVVAFGLSPR